MSGVEHRPALDLTRYHDKRRHGDIMVYATWFLFDEGEDWRPVLALVPTDEKTYRDITPYVIPQTNAWIWDALIGDPQAQALGAYAAAVCLGFNPHSVSTCQRILGIVQSHLGTLLTIPPKPSFNPTKAGLILQRDLATGSVEEIEVVDDL